MPSDILSLAYPAAYGVNTAEEPVILSDKNAGRFVQQTGNLRIHNNRFRTAFRTIEYKANHSEDTVLWRTLHTQQAIWFLPRSGQGTHYIGVGVDRIVESAAGRMFTLTPNKDLTFDVLDVSGGNVSTSRFCLAWMAQGENYVIRTDGVSQTQIWDGKDNVFFSSGYNPDAKSASRFPNRAGPTLYAGGRFWTVLFDRRIYASDSLHQTNQTDASDLLKFTDQSYDYLNVYFAPPTSEGDIVGLCVSVNSGNRDSRGQGEVLSMCHGPAVWAIQLGIPRVQWPDANMRTTRSAETGASGPDAFYVRDGDILMRTSLGIESLNLLARERATLGNPPIDLGADIRELLAHDDEELLLFASMINPPKLTRMYCTVSPRLVGSRHYHLGWVSANWNPLNQRVPQGFAWEGLSMLPPEMGRVIKFLPVQSEGQTRIFALVDKDDGVSKGLVELTFDEGQNRLADGSTLPVEWYLLTKRLLPGGPYGTSSLGSIWLDIENAKESIPIEVLVRSDKQRLFKIFRKLTFEPKTSEDDCFGCTKGADKSFCLGKAELSGIRWFQILVTGKGVCSIDISCRYGQPGAPEETVAPECVPCASEPVCNFDPFALSMP